MNDSYNPVSYECPYIEVTRFLVYQMSAILSGLGIVTNTYCIVVFALIITKTGTVGNMFKFLLVKAVHDDIQFIIQIFAPLYTCVSCGTYGTYSMQVWFIYFFYYIESINEFCSGWLELASTFDRLIMIYNILPACKTKLYFILVNIGLILYGSVFYLHYIFTFKIVERQYVVPFNTSSGNDTSYQTISYFAYDFTEFFWSQFGKGVRLWESMGRDAIVIFLLAVLNVLIMIKFRKTMSKKKVRIITNQHYAPSVTMTALTNKTDLAQRSERQGTNRQMLQSVQDAERNHTIMVVLTGINYIIGHSVTFFSQVILFDSVSMFKDCFIKMTLFIFYLSYVTPFFIYLGVNKLFRSYAFPKCRL